MTQFTLEHIAIHLVDRTLDEPRYALTEISKTDFTPDEWTIVERFFLQHLGAIWKAEESRRTRFATFKTDSDLGKIYQNLCSAPSAFFSESKVMARMLHRVSKKKKTSAGLLLALWLKENSTTDAPFLVLIKLDPEKAERIVYRADEVKGVLLGLAVEQIEKALPEVSDRVLKWAVIPHPSRHTGLKIRDQEGEPDPAQYFVEFLGCRLSPMGTEDLGNAVGAVEEIIDQQLSAKVARSASPLVFKILKEQEEVTPETIKKTLQEAAQKYKGLAGLAAVKDDELQQVMKAHQLDQYRVPRHVLRRSKLRYQLSEGIHIEGPWEAMKRRVEKVREGNEWVLTIRSQECDESYHV